LRFILADAINRAQTTETEEVLKALEKTDIETSSWRHFVFTSSHDIMVRAATTNAPQDYTNILMFQWQNGKQVPVYPQKIMDEAEAEYQYPPWDGPWKR
jgi:branched-chain amino acid transport system substrate-binding protein